MCIIIYCFRTKPSIWQGKFQFRTKNDTNIEAFLKNHTALLQRRYKYSEIKKMTDSLKVKLGQGGFGVVYKGKLLNVEWCCWKWLEGGKTLLLMQVTQVRFTFHIGYTIGLSLALIGTWYLYFLQSRNAKFTVLSTTSWFWPSQPLVDLKIGIFTPYGEIFTLPYCLCCL